MGAAFLTYVKVHDGIGEREDVEDKERTLQTHVDPSLACKRVISNHGSHLVYTVCTRNPCSKLLQHVSRNLASEPAVNQGKDSISA